MVEPARFAQVRDEQVEQAVIIVIAPDGSLGEPIVGHSGNGSDIHELAVTLIAVKPAFVSRVRRIAGCDEPLEELRLLNSPQTNTSILPSLLKSPQAADSLAIGTPSPLEWVTSSNMPPPEFRNSDNGASDSQPPRRSRTSRFPSLSKSARERLNA